MNNINNRCKIVENRVDTINQNIQAHISNQTNKIEPTTEQLVSMQTLLITYSIISFLERAFENKELSNKWAYLSHRYEKSIAGGGEGNTKDNSKSFHLFNIFILWYCD